MDTFYSTQEYLEDIGYYTKPSISVEEGKKYKTADGDIVQVRRNNLPYYCFSAVEVNGVEGDCFGEKWTSNGVAYHDDCGYNFIEEVG